MNETTPIQIEELIAGDVVCQLQPDGTPYKDRCFNSCFVEKIEEDGVLFYRPFIAAPLNGGLDNEKKASPYIGTERWFVPFGNPVTYSVLRSSPFREVK